ncbi:10853_t:CDS:2 [Acaulospora colombiana]|uniref:10853_t:CDS:1 n=1 Tax=Acaulospora colombiana TaxID=27376 RepID=A0ACA9LK01_9GLOM|nr:10853_t:CDS:2 [Acaulospora colombiana]
MDQDYNRSSNKKSLPSLIKSLKKIGKKDKLYCQNPSCNNVINENGVIYNYCSDSCQLAGTHPLENDNSGEDDFWSSRNNRDKTANSYNSSSKNNDSYAQSSFQWNATPWQAESPEDYPVWYNSTIDMRWKPQKTNDKSRTSPSGKTSGGEIECPVCTYYISPNRNVCDMCGTVVMNGDNKRDGREKEYPDDQYLNSPNSTKSNDARKNQFEYDDDYPDDLYVKSTKSNDTRKNRIDHDDDYPDDLYVGSPKLNNTRRERVDYEDEYPDDLYVGSPKLNNTRRERVDYEDEYPDDLYVSSSISNNTRRERVDYEDDEYLDDLYVSSPKSNDTRRKMLDYEDDEYLDDLYVSSPKLNDTRRKMLDYEDDYPDNPYGSYTVKSLRSSGTRKKVVDYEDDYPDDLYVGSSKTTRSSSVKKENERSIEYEDDLYVGPVSSTAKSRRQQLPTPPLQTPDETDQIPCHYCLYMNHPLMVNCERCDERLNKGFEETSTQDELLLQLAAEQFEEMSNEFKIQCSKCSFLNKGYATQCEMCFLPIIDDPFTAEEASNMIQCPGCTFMNDSSVITCEMCNKELPGAAELKRVYEEFYNSTTRIVRMNQNDPDYIAVQQRFLAGIPNAKIQAILRMNMPRRLVDAHENYKNQTRQIVHQMFHGTRVACNPEKYYDNNAELTFCATGCGLCGISQNGNLCSVSKHSGRMWFARHSSTSLGYCGSVQIKAMFSVDVVSPSTTPQDIIIVDKEAVRKVNRNSS